MIAVRSTGLPEMLWAGLFNQNKYTWQIWVPAWRRRSVGQGTVDGPGLGDEAPPSCWSWGYTTDTLKPQKDIRASPKIDGAKQG